MLFERSALRLESDALQADELAALHERGELSPGLVLKDPYVLDILGCGIATSSATSKAPFCASWSSFCWNWAPVSPSSPVRSGWNGRLRKSP